MRVSTARNFWLVSGSVACTLLLAALYLAVAPPRYRASATLLVQPQAVGTNSFTGSNFVRSQVEAVQSQAILSAAAQRLKIASDPEFGDDLSKQTPQRRTAAASERLSSIISVDNDGRSYVITVSARSATPEKAARIANMVAESFIDIEQSQRLKRNGASQQTLVDQLQRIRMKALATEQAAERYRREAGLILLSSDPDDDETYKDATPSSREFIEMSKQHAFLEAQRAKALASYDAQTRALALGRGNSTAEVLASPVVSNLRIREAELAKRRSELLARTKPGSPTIAPVEAELSTVRRAVAAEIARVHQAVALKARTSTDAFQNADRFLNQIVQHRNQDLESSTRLAQLRNEAQLNARMYRALAAQAARAEIQAATQTPAVLLISPALPPSRRVGQKGPTILLAAACFGLVVGLFAVALRSMRGSAMWQT